MIPASKTTWCSGNYVKNGILRNSQIPGIDENGNWGSPDGIMFDINKEKLTDEMTIHIKYLGKNIEFKIEKMKGDK